MSDIKSRLLELAKMIDEAQEIGVVYWVAGELEKIAETYTDRYEEGVRDTLSELSEVYGEGIEETDLWQEHFSQEKEGN